MCNIIYLCPTSINYACKWEGDATEIIQHFLESHNDLLMNSNRITVDVTQDSRENRLMESKNGLFLVQTKVCLETSKLLIRLRFLQLSSNETPKITYSIEVSNGSHGFTNENCIDRYNPVSNSDEGVVIDFEAIGLVSGTKVIRNLLITINVNGETLSDIQSHTYIEYKESEVDLFLQEPNLIEQLTIAETPLRHCSISERGINCVNCQQVMYPPIYICPDGHSACHYCKNGFCNSCSLKITELRNFDLEDYCKTLLYPCKYDFQGCPERYEFSQIRLHEVHCRYCIYSCALCKYSGKFWDIESHLRIGHPSTKIYDTMGGLSFCKGSNFAIINKEGVFYCSSNATDTYVEWKVIFCGPRERCFSCEVRLTSKKQYQHTKSYFLARIDNLFRWTIPYNELKHNCIKEKYAKLYISSY